MYGVESIVHPDYRGRGVGSKLMDARFETLRKLNLRGMIAGSLFIDYHKVAGQMTPQAYVQAVVEGRLFDTNLTKQLHKGFRVTNLIPNYVPEPRTQDFAAAIVWENPEYRPNQTQVTQKIIPARFDVALKPRRLPALPPAPSIPAAAFGVTAAAGS
jgi:hypothetical protein